MLRLFYSYSHKDEEWCVRLAAHLRVLGDRLLTDAWYDRKMRPGDDWVGGISDHLDSADIILLLVSANYFDSEFCMLEADRAMELYRSGKAVVVPVMLRHYNLSEAAFAALNPSPPAERPIDSSAWPDKDLALKTVSREIGDLARKRAGSGPRAKLLHPNREELANLLHHLCDRAPQRDALHRSLSPKMSIGKARRPFVIISQGSQSDSLEWFLNRLQNALLPWLIKQTPGRLSPLVWPDFAPRSSAADLFGARLADCFPVSPYADLKEMNRALARQNAVNLLPSSIPASSWDDDGERLFMRYLDLWEEWPRLLSDHALIPVVAIEYPANTPINGHISTRLSEIDFQSRPKLHGVVLPPMGAVEHSDFKDWIRHEKVRPKFASPEKAVEKSNEVHAKTFPVAMHPLAEELLPRFLEHL